MSKVNVLVLRGPGPIVIRRPLLLFSKPERRPLSVILISLSVMRGGFQITRCWYCRGALFMVMILPPEKCWRMS